MVTATMRTTIAAASSMEATAVRAQSKVGVSKQPTAKNANARILNTRKTKNVRRSARIRTTSATGTATMRTTIVAASSMEATAVVMSSKPTSTSANARTRISIPVNVLANAVHRSTRATATATMRTTIAAASSMEATAVIAQSRVGVSKQPTAKNASARIPNTQTTTNMPARTSAQRQGISAMVSATMRTTIAAVSSIKVTVVVPMLSKPTAKNANVNKRRTINSRYVCVVGGLHVYDDSDIYCTIELG